MVVGKVFCFSDLTPEERDEVCRYRDEEWYKNLVYRLADVIQDLNKGYKIYSEI